MENASKPWFSRVFAGLLLVGFLFFFTLLRTFFSLAASGPEIITYQGRLMNANGVPVASSSVNMVFELYTASSGGTCVWSNSSASCASATARSVTLTDGLFSENLGDTGESYAELTDIFIDNATLYLQVTVAGETLSPRKLITSSPYAVNAAALNGVAASGYLLATGDSASGEYSFTSSTNSVPTLLIDQNNNTGSTVNDTLGGALHISNTGNNNYGFSIYSSNGSASNALAYLSADNASFSVPVLQIDAAGGYGVYINRSNTSQGITIAGSGTGAGLTVSGSSSGRAIDISQSATPASGGVVNISSSATVPGILVDQNGNTGSTVDDTIGGALHISNTGNNNYGFTVYSNNGSASNALAYLSADNASFSVPVLQIDAAGGYGAYINRSNASQGITIAGSGTGAGLTVSGSSSGNAIDISQNATPASGGAVNISSSATVPGILIDQNADTGGTVSDSVGGALHISNTGNADYGFTLFSGNASPTSPLALIKANSPFFDQDLLNLYSNGLSTSLNITQVNNGGLDIGNPVIKVSNNDRVVGLHIIQDTVADATTAPTSQAIAIDVNEAANNDEVIIIRSDADGTPDTEFRFENDGDAFADGAWNGAGADFAEYFQTSDASLTSDYVVCRDTSAANKVKRCEANNTNVIGVVSSNAAFIGNNISADLNLENNPNYRIVGLLGQIDTFASADDGAIAIGDPLTASSTTSGYAGKVRGPANIIGYALEPLSAGRGTIKVLVQPTWYGGDILTRTGVAVNTAGDLQLSALQVATQVNTVSDSNELRLVGSAWNGTSAQDVSLGLRTKVSSANSYRLAIENDMGGEVASFSNNGDFYVSGKFYPSDRGTPQSLAYLYYDSTVGGGYIKTNAAGWNVGSYDFAEMFPSGETVRPGDVVVFGTGTNTVVRSSGKTYDDRIAGVVSTRPGFLAGEYKAGSYPIALSGRVPANVTAENGSVAVGDPLTTSSKPGYAMKATVPGPIIGYALEDVPAGEKQVSIFVRASYYDGSGPNVAPGAQSSVSSLPLGSNLANLDLTGVLNMNGGSILSVASIEGSGGRWEISANGDVITQGRFAERILSYQGELVDTFAVTSRETTVQLSGTVTLENGMAVVDFERIDPTFNDIISTTAPIRVLVTPSGITGQLYVLNKSTSGFMVKDTSGASGVPVDWLVIAYRKDFEPSQVVTEDVPEDLPQPVDESVGDETIVDISEDIPADTSPVTGDVARVNDTSQSEGDTQTPPDDNTADVIPLTSETDSGSPVVDDSSLLSNSEIPSTSDTLGQSDSDPVLTETTGGATP